jgi:hypothetical protein
MLEQLEQYVAENKVSISMLRGIKAAFGQGGLGMRLRRQGSTAVEPPNGSLNSTGASRGWRLLLPVGRLNSQIGAMLSAVGLLLLSKGRRGRPSCP